MRLTPKLALASQPSLHWLSSLKATQLQAIARATGIQSSGTKSILSVRIESALAPYLAQHQHGHGHGHGNAGPSLEKGRHDQPLRILSIDMGIRNLAFAVLSVPRREDSSSGSARALSSSTPELLAWRRLAVSEIGELDLQLGSTSNVTKKDSLLTSNTKEGCPSQTPLLDFPTLEGSASDSTPTSIQKEKERDPFSPALYAKTAYTLITTLLNTYKPTHILIERQRFRSGGASAVQEWTLRVGVLEGMLYAVLETLRGERLLGAGSEAGSEGVVVQGVEPKRVVGFWGDVVGERTGGAGSDEGEGGRKRVSAREVKRGKIDLVGRWLDASLSSSSSRLSSSSSGSGVDGEKVLIPHENTVVRDLADAYLRRLRGENGRKKKNPLSGEIQGGSEVGKLDDLADCLLQGVTWLEWQVMRERIAREGVEALKATSG